MYSATADPRKPRPIEIAAIDPVPDADAADFVVRDTIVWLRRFQGPGSRGTNEAADHLEALHEENKRLRAVMGRGFVQTLADRDEAYDRIIALEAERDTAHGGQQKTSVDRIEINLHEDGSVTWAPGTFTI
jgi:hypothetical protein